MGQGPLLGINCTNFSVRVLQQLFLWLRQQFCFLPRSWIQRAETVQKQKTKQNLWLNKVHHILFTILKSEKDLKTQSAFVNPLFGKT